MPDMREFSDSGDLYVYVSFHIPHEASSTATFNLRKTVQECFTGEAVGEFAGERSSAPEIIYRIQKPIIEDETQLHDFFEKLEKIFNMASDFRPHFTQLAQSEEKN